MALINPAKSNPNVIIYAVAARDKTRAAAFAKKHGIPHVKESYEDLLDDPAIDAVYNPLPNGLHFEWTYKALAKGKHVLLEKPSTSNAAEAEKLFHSPLLSQPNAPVLFEAFHNRFTPACEYSEYMLRLTELRPRPLTNLPMISHRTSKYVADND